jgi:hypothetical protein
LKEQKHNDLVDRIWDDYWSHIDLQTEGCVLDWFKAYWRLALEILPDMDKIEMLSMVNLTPELLQHMIRESRRHKSDVAEGQSD